ncbi:hypothetical protein PtB15_1B701 [Puccinia triticina]|nr:hypothetical protein PtB15_1B701 [Puccinia triticina]
MLSKDSTPLIQINEARLEVKSLPKPGGPPPGASNPHGTDPQESLAFLSQKPAPPDTKRVPTQPIPTASLPGKEPSKPKLQVGKKSKLMLAKYIKSIKEDFYKVLAWLDVKFYKLRMRFLRPATRQELQRYTAVRNEMSGLLAHGLVKLNDKDVLDANTLAKRLDEKLSPPINSYKPADDAPPSRSEYEDYLARLGLRYKSDSGLEELRRRWSSQPIEISKKLTPDEEETRVLLKAAISNLKRSEYPSEHVKRCKNVIESFQTQFEVWQKESKGHFLPKEPLDYFPSIFVDHKLHWNKKLFVQARTAQLQLAKGAGFPMSPVKAPLTPLGKLLRETPSSIPLEEILHSWTIAEGFGVMLEYVTKAVKNLLVNELQEPLSVALNKPLELDSSLKTIFASTSKEDVAWCEKRFQDFHGTSATPSMVFEQLRGLPEERIRLRSAFDNHSNLLAPLQEEERQSLQKALSDPAKFAGALSVIESHYEPGSTASEKLKDFRNEAIYPDDNVGRPFVETLHQQGIIDETICRELNPPGGLSRQNFLNALGKQEDFTSRLMTNLKNELLKKLDTSEGNPPQTLASIAEHLAQLHTEKLRETAESSYIKAGLFKNPPEYNFVEALNVFDPKGVRELAKLSDHKEMLVKAYIQAILPQKRPTGEYKSEMDRFLSQIKIPQSGHPPGK